MSPAAPQTRLLTCHCLELDGQAVSSYYRPGATAAPYGPPRDFLYYPPCLGTASAGRYTVSVQTKRPLTSLWHSSLIAFVGFNTVLPPNSPSCLADTYGDSWALASASSYHDSGVNVLMADGSVRFITDSVDTGNLSAAEVTTGQSPYGVWGALGTRASGESPNSQD